MADLPLLIGASLGHFKYSRSQATCQQKHDIKLHKNKPFILGILYNAIMAALDGFTRREICQGYKNIGKQRKARQRLASGFISVFLFYGSKSYLSYRADTIISSCTS